MTGVFDRLRAALRAARRGKPRGRALYAEEVRALARPGEILSVVVVGANDGRLNDPMHRIMRGWLASSSRILLVEPQRQLAPLIRKNYAFHPDVTVVEAAVGAPGETTFYAVSEAFWSRLQPPYARKWPLYRAPTGVTSADPERVRRWIRQVGQGAVDADQAMISFTTRVAPLRTILEEAGFPARIDVLQVDAEGMDDAVLAHADLDVTQPRLIHVETSMLPRERAEAMLARFAPRYDLVEAGANTLFRLRDARV